MKKIKLILQLAFVVFGVWALKQMVSENDHRYGDSEDVEVVANTKQHKPSISEVLVESKHTAEVDSGIIINEEKIGLDNAVYESNDDGAEIIISFSGKVLTISLNSLNEGAYSLADEGNSFTIFDGNGFDNYNEGVVEISSVTNSGITGSFKAGELYGKFVGVQQMPKTQRGEVGHIHSVHFSSTGVVTRGMLVSTFKYDSRIASLTILENNDYDFTAEINDAVITPTSVTFRVSEDDIDFVIIDKLNRSQVTIQYKNGESLVLL